MTTNPHHIGPNPHPTYVKIRHEDGPVPPLRDGTGQWWRVIDMCPMEFGPDGRAQVTCKIVPIPSPAGPTPPPLPITCQTEEPWQDPWPEDHVSVDPSVEDFAKRLPPYPAPGPVKPVEGANEWLRFEHRDITGLGRRRVVDARNVEHCPSCDHVVRNIADIILSGGQPCDDRWHRRGSWRWGRGGRTGIRI